jgi:regulator of cell morphogenesis and NO signaling
MKESNMPRAVETVRDIAVRQPSAIRVFERFGIDYCCGGSKPLGVACSERELALSAVLEALAQAASAGPSADETDWSTAPLRALCDHILSRHHVFLRDELPRLSSLAAKVVQAHGSRHPELGSIQSALAQLDTELMQHMAKEEQVLFPYLGQLEAAMVSGGARPPSCFGSVASPIAVMTQEHDAAGTMLAELRRLSHDYQPPEDACASYHAFYDGLGALEQDLHQHIHLENNILFPRAVALEALPRG